MLFDFNTLPNDIEEALQWMQNEFANGRKRIYPGWKGVS